MKKIVINKCYGGFGISPLAYKRIAEILGKEIYFIDPITESQITRKQAEEKLFFLAYSVPNPYERGISTPDADGLYKTANKISAELIIPDFDDDRSNPVLIQVVEELKDKANTRFSKLKIVEIPDDIEFEISYYDGMETVEETHRKWF